MPQVTAFAGGREIIGSGTIICEPKEEAKLQIDNLTFKLVFKTERKEPRVDVAQEGTTTAIYTFVDFSNPFGTNWNGIVATLNGRFLSLAISVRLTGDEEKGSRTIHYTLSLGDPVPAGGPPVG